MLKSFSLHILMFLEYIKQSKNSKTKLVLLYHWIEEAKDLFTGEC